MRNNDGGAATPAGRPHRHDDLDPATAAALADLGDQALRLSAMPGGVDETDLDIALTHEELDCLLPCLEAVGQLMMHHMLERRLRALIRYTANQAIADNEDEIQLWARHIVAADDFLDIIVGRRRTALNEFRALARRMCLLDGSAPANDQRAANDTAGGDEAGGAP